MDAEVFREEIIRPALKLTGTWSNEAENLLLGTALSESNIDVLRQIGGGPALSFYQIEPATYHDCLRYLALKKELKERILSACYLDVFPPEECLIWNLRLATLIARVKYWMIPEKLPFYRDAESLCEYYIKYYNAGGSATMDRCLMFFAQACL